MSGFNANSLTYNITAENEVASILSHFESEFVFDIIRDSMEKKYSYNYISSPNLINALDMNFKQIEDYYQKDLDIIRLTKIETYKEIINVICKEYNLEYRDIEDLDYYSAAYYVYDFFVSNFCTYLVSFFTDYIIKESENIYNTFNLGNMKKNKDSSTLYNKKIYKDPNLAIINANLEYVINNMGQLDIGLEYILLSTYKNFDIVNFILRFIRPFNNFFRESYIQPFSTDIKAELLSSIRIEIQKVSMVDNPTEFITNKGVEQRV